jgi:hypothetical protein
MAGNVVSIEVLADVRKLVSGVAETNSHLGSIEGMAAKAGSVLKNLFAGAAVIGAIKLVTDGIGEIVSGASDLQQNLGGAQAVFGDAFSGIEESANGAAQAVGLSKSEYLKMSTALGAGLKNSGIKDYTGATQELISKGADLAAQFGGSSADAVNALGAAMRGEYDSLEKYGISMKQSDVDARLAAEGKDKLTGAAKRQAETEAKLAIIREQTTSANGAFSRENNTLAGQQERLTAMFENTKDQLGTAFLPMLTKVASAFSEKIMPQIQKFIDWIGPKVQSGLESLSPIIDTVEKFLGALTGSDTGSGTAFDPVISAGTKVRQAFDDIKKAWTDFTSGFTGAGTLGTSIAGAFNPAIDAGAKFRGVFEEAKAAALNLWASLQHAVDVIVPIVTQLFDGIMAKVRPLMPTIMEIFTAIASIVSSAMDIVGSVIRIVMDGIKVFWDQWGATITAVVSNIFGMVINIFGAAFDWIKTLFKAAAQALHGDWSGALQTLMTGAQEVWVKIKAAFGDGVAAVWAAIKGIGEKVAAGFTDMINDAKRMAGNIIDGIVSGIRDGLGRVGEVARDLATRLWQEFKKSLGIASPSKIMFDLSGFAVDGAVLGVTRNVAKMASAGKYLAASLSDSFSPDLSMPAVSLSGAGAGAYGSRYSPPIINITVQVPATANQVEVGREISNALNVYYAANGAR